MSKFAPGQHFGKLTILSILPHRFGLEQCKCQCECGNILNVSQRSLRIGASTCCNQCKPPKPAAIKVKIVCHQCKKEYERELTKIKQAKEQGCKRNFCCLACYRKSRGRSKSNFNRPAQQLHW